MPNFAVYVIDPRETENDNEFLEVMGGYTPGDKPRPWDDDPGSAPECEIQYITEADTGAWVPDADGSLTATISDDVTEAVTDKYLDA